MANRKDAERFIQAEIAEFSAAVADEHDLVIDLVRFHLLAENALERIILSTLARGDRVIEEAGLSFAQKLTVVHSFESVGDATIQTLRQLNKVRNQCVHQKGRSLSASDIEVIGRPLGKEFTALKHANRDNLRALVRETFRRIYGGLVGPLARSELGDKLVETSDSPTE